MSHSLAQAQLEVEKTTPNDQVYCTIFSLRIPGSESGRLVADPPEACDLGRSQQRDQEVAYTCSSKKQIACIYIRRCDDCRACL